MYFKRYYGSNFRKANNQCLTAIYNQEICAM
jgi:hypothetical protein